MKATKIKSTSETIKAAIKKVDKAIRAIDKLNSRQPGRVKAYEQPVYRLLQAKEFLIGKFTKADEGEKKAAARFFEDYKTL